MIRRARTTVALALAVLLAASSLTISSPTPAAASSDGLGRNLMGMYPQWNSQNPTNFGAMAGRSIESLTLFLDRDSWPEMSSSAGGLGGLWRDHPSLKVISFAMSVNNESLAYGNSGANDSNIRNIAQKLVDTGLDGSVMRIGWEHNGSWNEWSSLSDPEGYSAYFRRIVNIFRSVSPNFRFEWNVNIRYTAVDLASYPGDAYVDVIGMDIYNSSWGESQRDPADRWQTYLERGAGLRWHRDFAAAHGKPMAFSEWGMTNRHLDGVNDDDPYFIDKMLRWIGSNNVAYANYFDSGWGDLSDYPNAEDQYGASMQFVPAATDPAVGGPVPTTQPPATTQPPPPPPVTTQPPAAPQPPPQPPVTTQPPAAPQPRAVAPPVTTAPPPATTAPPPTVCRDASNPTRTPLASSANGYWILDAEGRVHRRGDIGKYGDVRGQGLDVIGLAAHPDGKGYWIAESNGTIHAFGSARNYGDLRNIKLSGPIQSLIAAPDGSGYWMIGSDGGVFAFNVAFSGSMGGIALNSPIISGAAGPTGGYWLVGGDGGVFSFGVPFFGSTGGLTLAAPVSAIAAHPAGTGYWLYAQDGGVFSFGVPFFGSIPGLGLCNPPTAVELEVTSTGNGYWILAETGQVYPFGDAPNYGDISKSVGGTAIDIAVAL